MNNKFKLTLTTRDGELLAQWDESDFGDLSKPLCREHFTIEVLSQIESMGTNPSLHAEYPRTFPKWAKAKLKS